jgi:hypothetical protein
VIARRPGNSTVSTSGAQATRDKKKKVSLEKERNPIGVGRSSIPAALVATVPLVSFSYVFSIHLAWSTRSDAVTVVLGDLDNALSHAHTTPLFTHFASETTVPAAGRPGAKRAAVVFRTLRMCTLYPQRLGARSLSANPTYASNKFHTYNDKSTYDVCTKST